MWLEAVLMTYNLSLFLWYPTNECVSYTVKATTVLIYILDDFMGQVYTEGQGQGPLLS